LALLKTPKYSLENIGVLVKSVPFLGGGGKNMSETPTMAKPAMTKMIPIHRYTANLLRRKTMESKPVKMMTAPLNIWNEEA